MEAIISMGKKCDERDIYDVRSKEWNNYSGIPVEMETGAMLALNPRCEYSRKRFIYRKSEVPEVNYMRNIVRYGDCVLDIGANIGYWTTVLSSQVGNTGRVLAFEPNPNTFKILVKNIDLNLCCNAVAYNVGIADKNVIDKLYADELHSGDDRTYCPVAGTNGHVRRIIEINLRTLNSFNSVIDLKRLSFIKIDVQGFEPMVLKGAIDILKLSNPILLVEFSSSHYAEGGSSTEDFYNIYNELGFKSYKIPHEVQTSTDALVYEEIDLFKLDSSYSGNIILKRGL
jgi:FkbM family methyltransferase